MTTALGLTGDNRFAARLLLVLEIRGAFGSCFHEVKVTLIKGHGSRVNKKSNGSKPPLTFTAL
jgi:hypothetical protein